jgi:hypothetical protein
VERFPVGDVELRYPGPRGRSETESANLRGTIHEESVSGALVSTTALAFHCPVDVKKIDAALAKNPSISASQLATVKELRDSGEANHKAGKHQEAVDELAKAMAILGIK